MPPTIADRAAAALAVLLPPLLWIALRHGRVYWTAAAFVLLAQMVLQARLLWTRADGRPFSTARSIFPAMLRMVAGVYGRAAGAMRTQIRQDRWLAPCLAALVCLTVGLQLAGGAYSAEFDGHPDEAAHFVSSLLVYDYITQWPHQNPVRWAEQYYLHYPKVAIGHWPPGYDLLEAVWWLFWTPSRSSAMALNAALCVAAGAVLYRLLRASASGWLAAAVACLMLASPIVQESFSRTMADLPSLFLATLFLAVLARFLDAPSLRLTFALAALLAAGLFVKGTTVMLIFAVPLAVIVAGRWRNPVNKKLLLAAGAAAAIAVLCAVCSASSPRLHFVNLQFIRAGNTHMAAAMDLAAGWGCMILALGGIVAAFSLRRVTAAGAAGVLLSMAAVSFFLRDAVESRHYIMALPALLLLATEFGVWTSSRSRFAPLLLVPAVAFFPFQIYRQQVKGFAAMRSRIHLPARMLVSSTSSREGAWIAEVALGETRPASLIARASQILAKSDWNGGVYHLTTKTPREVEQRLDQLGLDAVVLDVSPSLDSRPHETVLRTMLHESASWSHCAQEGSVEAFCRVMPRSLPRIPLQIDLGSSIGRVIVEQ